MSFATIFSPAVFQRLLISGSLEFGPIILFLISFHYLHIYKATLILMVTTIISTVLTYKIEKRLPYLALYVALITIIFGYITLVLREPRFIQIRDTLYDVTCALTLIAGLLANVSFLKLAFHSAFPMSDRAWNRLTYSWIFYFITLASLNEYLRRALSLAEWFQFKSIVVLVTIVFGIVTLALFYEKGEPEKGEK